MSSQVTAGPAPVDALADIVDGCYRDALVTVRAAPPGRPRRSGCVARTRHFDLTPSGGRVLLDHVVPAHAVDDDLAGLLRDELFTPGWVQGGDLFERLFTGVVRTGATDAADSWERFYRNTLARLDAHGGARRVEDPNGRRHPSGHGSIDGYAPVHQHALDLLADGSVLELGCCFGFLALRAARTGRPTTASDVSRGTIRLLQEMAPRLGVPLTTVTADAARYPAVDGQADTVLAIHLLEHLEPGHGVQVLAEALRLARRRVVVAVPLEADAEEVFGHVRTVTLEDLHRWGVSTGLRFDVHEHHGGWLVLDR